MRRDRIEEANALAEKIGSIITKRNKTLLTNIDPRSGTKELWEKVRELTKRTSIVQPPNTISAESLNQHYATISYDQQYSAPQAKHTALHTTENELKEYQIFNLLDHLRHSATGLDGLPAWFLRISAPSISATITYLFNLSLLTSFVLRSGRSP